MCLEIKYYFLDQWLKVSKHVFSSEKTSLASWFISHPRAQLPGGKQAITASPGTPLLNPEAPLPRPESRRVPFPG